MENTNAIKILIEYLHKKYGRTWLKYEEVKEEILEDPYSVDSTSDEPTTWNLTDIADFLSKPFEFHPIESKKKIKDKNIEKYTKKLKRYWNTENAS